jgi:hypothetical protein
MNRETASEPGAHSPAVAIPIEDLATPQPDDGIQLDSCPAFERIVVRTDRSMYDIVVLSGDTGEVMVRGGRFFPEFRRATIAGSIIGRSAVKLRSICVGFPMELHVNGKVFVTSRIQAVSRFGLRDQTSRQQC